MEKSTIPLDDPEAGLGDRVNMVFSGTSAVYGRGRAVVVGTGMQTEIGKIASMIQKAPPRTDPSAD